jgi:hypothetical protein
MICNLLVRATGLVVAALMWTVSAQAQVSFYGLTSAQSGRNLVTFTSATPGIFSSNVAITGDVDTGVDLFSLDLNRGNNTLYSVGSLGRGEYALFSIATNGVATRIGNNLGVNIGTENAGLDYDPATNMFRLVTNEDQVFTINPLTGLASAGQEFFYAAGDTRGARNPNVVAGAYDGQLYVLDRNGPGNSGLLSTLSGTTLTSVASLNQQLNANASFDIASNGQAFFNNGAVADRLFELDLTNGTATDRGALELRLTGLTAGLAAATPAVPEPATWATMILGFGIAGTALRRRRTQTAHA